MESDDDYQMMQDPSPEVPRPRFKRLKKASKSGSVPSTMSIHDVFDLPKVDFSELEALEASKSLEESTEHVTRSGSGFDEKSKEKVEGANTLEDSTELVSSQSSDDEIELEPCLDNKGKQGLGVKRSLDFGDDNLKSGDVAKENHEQNVEEVEDLSVEKLGMQQDFEGVRDLKEEDKSKKKKKKTKDDGDGEVKEEDKSKKKKKKTKDDGEVKAKDLASNKRREAKERKACLQQLHVDTQRLLRESKDAAFKPIPVVHKPISSVLEKIRKRKLEVSRKTVMLISNSCIGKTSASREITMEVDTESANSEEQRVDKLEIELEEEVDAHGKGRTTDTSKFNEISEPPITRSSEFSPDEMGLEERPNPVFRAPVDDTQDLFDDSEPAGCKEEMFDDPSSSPVEEVMAPSVLALNLKFDSAPQDESFSDEECINPCTKGVDGHNSPKGDPVKAFVDDEAEEEDDSENDLPRFGEKEEDEEDFDNSDLNDLIATYFEEKPIDNEKRNELHQKWLEQQDADGTENLLQRLNCVVKQKETISVDECEEAVNDVTDLEAVPKSAAQSSIKKAKQMIMQMFVDKDDVFLSDEEDEETEKKHVKQHMLYQSELTSEIPPIESESSSEIFGLIKNLNTVPENKRRQKVSSFFDTVLGDSKKKSSLKSSFLGRVTKQIPSSHKQGSTTFRSFIFGRDDSNSRSSMSMSEESSDTVLKENGRSRNSTKFSTFQAKSSSQGKSTGAGASVAAPSFEILTRSSAPSNVYSRDVLLDLPKSLFADLRVSKRSMKAEGKR